MWKPSIIGSWYNPTTNVSFDVDSNMNIEWIDYDGSENRDGKLIKDAKKENTYTLKKLKYFYDVTTDTVSYSPDGGNTSITCFRSILV